MLSVVLNVHRSSACRLARYRSWTASWRIWCPDPVRKPSGWWPERWRRTPTSTRIKPWQARGKSWSAASTAFWTPCKSHTGLADQVYTHIQDASFCEHHVGAFVGSLSDFCRMCVWLWKRFFFYVSSCWMSDAVFIIIVQQTASFSLSFAVFGVGF